MYAYILLPNVQTCNDIPQQHKHATMLLLLRILSHFSFEVITWIHKCFVEIFWENIYHYYGFNIFLQDVNHFIYHHVHILLYQQLFIINKFMILLMKIGSVFLIIIYRVALQLVASYVARGLRVSVPLAPINAPPFIPVK